MASNASAVRAAMDNGTRRPALDLAATVEASALRTAPFDHIYMERVFAPAFYQQLLAALPAPERYREMEHDDAMQADGHSTRRKFYLFPEHLWFLPAKDRALWRQVSRALMAPETQAAFKRKFRRVLEARFGRPIETLRFYPIPILLRDLGGYRIGIHYDSPGKAITVQFYLPRDESQTHMGTIFHEAYDEPGASRIHPLQFRPATGYAFPVAIRRSWHSVARTTAGDGVRNSMMVTYYVQESPRQALLHRLRRLAVFLAYYFRR